MTQHTPEPTEVEKVLWCVERMLDGTYKSPEHKKLDILNYVKRTLTTLHQKHAEELEKAAGIERWNIGAWIEQQDFAQKEGERNNDPASVWAVQTVIKQINQYLAAPAKTDKQTEV